MAVESDQRDAGKPYQVAVVPITHLPHSDPHVAIEIPPAVKKDLGLDEERSWIVVDEFNTFTWPGYDLCQSRKRKVASIMGSCLPSCSTKSLTGSRSFKARAK
jgi:hypothetical protein